VHLLFVSICFKKNMCVFEWGGSPTGKVAVSGRPQASIDFYRLTPPISALA
jgi:hypothetical protein